MSSDSLIRPSCLGVGVEVEVGLGLGARVGVGVRARDGALSLTLTKRVMKKPTPTTIEAMRGFLKKGEKATPGQG